jgi:hypothetical protein
MGGAADFVTPTMAALCHGVNSLQLLKCVVVEPVDDPLQNDSLRSRFA